MTNSLELIPAQGVASLSLERDEVHLWCTQVDLTHPPEARFVQCLSAVERQRASSYVFENHRHRSLHSAAMLRRLLSAYTRQPATSIAYSHNEWGKPCLRDGGLEFNVSHSQDMLAFAFTEGHPVGVDIEARRKIPEAQSITQNHFAKSEQAALGNFSGQQHLTAFINVWTRKEACLKAVGAGLNLPLDHFEVSVSFDEPARVISVGGNSKEGGKWSLFHFEPRPDISGCIALPARGLRVIARTFHWYNFG